MTKKDDLVFVKKQHMHTILIFLDKELDKQPQNSGLQEIKKLLYLSIFYGNGLPDVEDLSCKI